MANKTLLYIDQNNINANIQSIENAISVLNPFFIRYNNLELPEMLTENFTEFIQTPKVYFVKILSAGETLKIGQLELDPVKVYDLFPLPDGVNELVNDIENMKFEFSNYSYAIQHIIIQENKLVVNPNYVNEVTERNTFYVETPDQESAIVILKRVAQDLTTLKALQKKSYRNPNQWVLESFTEPHKDHKSNFTVNLEVIKNY
ncbi:hypothetical protein [Chryseobacterium sp.]|uniref:hypothetical protein n=1 Tax=Chryseobacterium sp. TaxID=1871047 RepID=UPI002FC69AA5